MPSVIQDEAIDFYASAIRRLYRQVWSLQQGKSRMWRSVPQRDPENRSWLSSVRPRVRNKPSWIPGHEQGMEWNRAANAGKPTYVVSMEPG